MVIALVASATAAAWIYLLAARGGFWRAAERDGWPMTKTAQPAVVAVIPARNEAEVVGRSLRALLAQDYGPLSVILVDDNSTDDTAAIARSLGAGSALTVLRGAPLPSGWTGKLWAVKQGVDAAQERLAGGGYLLLLDADIACAPDTVSRLVARSEANGLVLNSLMAKLRCASLAERAMVPAFIFFFAMLYPFAWVNRPGRATAAAAGGCMLVDAAALRRAGGIAAIRSALIDDCALAAVMKRVGPISLALTERVQSLRPYPRFDDMRRMIARSAYTQLRHSRLILLAAMAGMALVYLAPPLLALFAAGPARWLGLFAWALMATAFQPTLRFYRLSPLWGIALPAIAALYMLFTFDSALQHARGQGGAWKGRVQSSASGS